MAIKELIADAKARMHASVETVRRELATMRTGRASLAMLDGIRTVRDAACFRRCRRSGRRIIGISYEFVILEANSNDLVITRLRISNAYVYQTLTIKNCGGRHCFVQFDLFCLT